MIRKYWDTTLLIIIAYCSSYPVFLLTKYDYLTKDGLFFYFAVSFFSVIGMFLVPLYVIKIKKENPADFGFRLPENILESVKITVISTIVFLVLIYIYAHNPEFQKYYHIDYEITWWFLLEILFSLVYFISEEFFFRGYLFFDLLKKTGLNSIWIGSLIFAFLHIGKPTLEVFFALPLGIVLSVISYKTKSFLPSAIIHFTIALGLNLIIISLK